jgi:hypothetical protein
MSQKFRLIGILSFSFFMSDSLLAFPGLTGVISEIYLLNKVVLVHIFGDGPVNLACTNNLMLSSTQNLVQAILSRQDSYNRTPREIYNYIDKTKGTN